MTNRLFSRIVSKRVLIIRGFQVFYGILLLVMYLGVRSAFYDDENYVFFYNLGVTSGRIALVFFVITLIPGIANRFGIRNKTVALLRIFRRYIGISVYLFALFHFLLVRFVRSWASSGGFVPSTLFEVFGLVAFLLLFVLFVTSNDISVKRLGIWWYRIHRVIYLVMWLILFHVAFQRFSLWTGIIGVTVIAMMGSFVFRWWQVQRKSSGKIGGSRQNEAK